MFQKWTPAEIPSQTGKVALVTGATSGIGYHTARHLARAGATVLLTGRHAGRVEKAVDRLLRETRSAPVESLLLDLASFESIHAAADEVNARFGKLDLLVNNAGIMALPERRETADGFEMQMGTNHLGHFLLTGLLLPSLLAAPAARVVTVSSIAHRRGQIHLDDLQALRSYNPKGVYCNTKLANALFGFELDRKLRAAGSRARSLVAHPGVSNTEIFTKGPGQSGGVKAAVMPVLMRTLLQSSEMGALPTLYAATAPQAEGGRFFGPHGWLEFGGYPIEVKPSGAARDRKLARELWELSEQLTGTSYEALLSPQGA